MDHYGDVPMPSFDERVKSLLKLVKNPTARHVALANQVASETGTGYSMSGYTNGVRANEERRFLEAQGGSEPS
jgi:hypothetical protein